MLTSVANISSLAFYYFRFKPDYFYHFSVTLIFRPLLFVTQNIRPNNVSEFGIYVYFGTNALRNDYFRPILCFCATNFFGFSRVTYL